MIRLVLGASLAACALSTGLADQSGSGAVCLDLGGDRGPAFGRALSINGEILALGDVANGRVATFAVSGGTWRAGSPITGDATGFGHAVALDAETGAVVVGAWSPGTPGAVDRHQETGLTRLATGDGALEIGRAVAAEKGQVAFARRSRDAARGGDVLIVGGDAVRRIAPPYPADDFAADVAMEGGRVLAGAPASGPIGGALLEGPDGTRAMFTHPGHPRLGRLGAHVALSRDLCVVSGDGYLGDSSVVWLDCDPTRPVIVAGRGPVAAAGPVAAFAGPDLDAPAFGVAPTVKVHLFGPEGPKRTIDVAGPSLGAAPWRRVALSDTHLALSWGSETGARAAVLALRALLDGPSHVEIDCEASQEE